MLVESTAHAQIPAGVGLDDVGRGTNNLKLHVRAVQHMYIKLAVNESVVTKLASVLHVRRS